jgi:hypothetical protein
MRTSIGAGAASRLRNLQGRRPIVYAIRGICSQRPNRIQKLYQILISYCGSLLCYFKSAAERISTIVLSQKVEHADMGRFVRLFQLVSTPHTPMKPQSANHEGSLYFLLPPASLFEYLGRHRPKATDLEPQKHSYFLNNEKVVQTTSECFLRFPSAQRGRLRPRILYMSAGPKRPTLR